MRSEMAIGSEEVQVIVEGENQSRFSPEGDINKVKLRGYLGKESEKSISN